MFVRLKRSKGAKDPFPVLPSAQPLLLVPGFVSRAARSFLNPQPHDVVHQKEEEEEEEEELDPRASRVKNFHRPKD